MNFCTIITPNYLSYAEAVAASLRALGKSFTLHVLVAGDRESLHCHASEIRLHSMTDLCHEGLGRELYQRYFLHDRKDAFRWSMKSVFLLHLLEKPEIDRVAFVDPDLAFFGDPSFLLERLRASHILLTPHWRAHVPQRDPDNFAHLQTKGLFNAGFVGASRGAESALTWWGETCLYRCDVAPTEGLFVDQAYLDMMPIYFEGVEIVRHRGCNVANWNLGENQRVLINGNVLINGRDPIVFIHFTASTIRGIVRGDDPLLQPHLDRWLQWRGADKEELAKYEKPLASRRHQRHGVWRAVRTRLKKPARAVWRLFH